MTISEVKSEEMKKKTLDFENKVIINSMKE